MSVTRITQKYIAEHPSIKDCLLKGLINYSALAREVCDFHQIKRFDAVLIACRRYLERMKSQPTREKKIVNLIKAARIKLKNKMLIAIIEKPRDFENLYALQKEVKTERGDFHLIEGEEVVTIISNAEFEDNIRSEFKNKVKRISTSLAQVSMVFDEKIETTSGVVSFIYGLLADNGINVREEMSCWTDLLIVIDENDVAKAMRVLSLPQE